MVKRALDLGGALYCIERSLEGDEERIAMRGHLTPIPALDRVPDNFIVLFENRSVMFSQLIVVSDGPLDTREQECQSARLLDGGGTCGETRAFEQPVV